MEHALSRKNFYILLLLVEGVILALAAGLAQYREIHIINSLWGSFHTGFIAVSLFSGMVMGCIPCLLARFTRFGETYDSLFNKMIGFRIRPLDCILISAVAGICEEILFRAVLQPWIGIWLTSVIFVIAHGYCSFSDHGKNILGVFAFVVSMMAGEIFIFWGLLPAVVFHFACDFWAFWLLGKRQRQGEAVNQHHS